MWHGNMPCIIISARQGQQTRSLSLAAKITSASRDTRPSVEAISELEESSLHCSGKRARYNTHDSDIIWPLVASISVQISEVQILTIWTKR